MDRTPPKQHHTRAEMKKYLLYSGILAGATCVYMAWFVSGGPLDTAVRLLTINLPDFGAFRARAVVIGLGVVPVLLVALAMRALSHVVYGATPTGKMQRYLVASVATSVITPILAVNAYEQHDANPWYMGVCGLLVLVTVEWVSRALANVSICEFPSMTEIIATYKRAR